MATTSRSDRRMGLEEFHNLDTGETRYELIDGIPVAHALPTFRHGRMTVRLAAAIHSSIRAAGLPCEAEIGTGLAIRTLPNDYELGPDVLVRCGSGPDGGIRLSPWRCSHRPTAQWTC
jgi:Uma2 family endonuclease